MIKLALYIYIYHLRPALRNGIKKKKKYMFIRRERNREKEINFVLHIYFLINFLDGGARRFL
jgi:hypothetical protein